MAHFAGDMITENINLIDYYVGCHNIIGKYLCLAILINNEECNFFAQHKLFGPNVYMCCDYGHLDNLSYISAYRNHNVQQYKMKIP